MIEMSAIINKIFFLLFQTILNSCLMIDLFILRFPSDLISNGTIVNFQYITNIFHQYNLLLESCKGSRILMQKI